MQGCTSVRNHEVCFSFRARHKQGERNFQNLLCRVQQSFYFCSHCLNTWIIFLFCKLIRLLHLYLKPGVFSYSVNGDLFHSKVCAEPADRDNQALQHFLAHYQESDIDPALTGELVMQALIIKQFLDVNQTNSLESVRPSLNPFLEGFKTRFPKGLGEGQIRLFLTFFSYFAEACEYAYYTVKEY